MAIQPVDTRFLTSEQAAGVARAKATVAKVKQGPIDIGGDVLMKRLEGFLLGKSDMVSSAVTGIDAKIGAAIAGVRAGQEASAERIESQFGREISFQREQFGQQRTTQLEGRRGFATNVAALQQLDERTEKSLRDFAQRKQELILAGESEAAGQIAQMQLQAIQFKQQAEQQTFSNLLGLGRFALEQEREQRLQDEITRGETRIIGNPSDGIFAIRTDAQGNSRIEILLPATETGEDAFLTLNEMGTLSDRGAEFIDPITGESRPFTVGDRLSDVTNVGLKEGRQPSTLEVRGVAFDTASQFTDLFRAWGVPTEGPIKDAVERLFGVGKTKLNDAEFKLFLSSEFGLDTDEVSNILKVRESAD